MEFSKLGGCDAFKFYERFNHIREYFGEYINATY
jgi:hypothetical protein